MELTEIKVEYITLAEASKYLSVSIPTLYRWKDTGKLSFYKIGGTSVRIKMDDLQKLIEKDE